MQTYVYAYIYIYIYIHIYIYTYVDPFPHIYAHLQYRGSPFISCLSGGVGKYDMIMLSDDDD